MWRIFARPHCIPELPAALALTCAVCVHKRFGFVAAQQERVIREDEVRRHNTASDAWISFNDAVYDITGFIARHPMCSDLDWANRVAGRRFEHFLGRDAFGPVHQNCGPDNNCSRNARKALADILEPFRIGSFQPMPPSAAARQWPDVTSADTTLYAELPNGTPLKSWSIHELQTMFPKVSRVVTHKCTSSGNISQKQWAGVRVRDLLPTVGALCVFQSDAARGYDPLLTFVGMDGFGYSILRSRAMMDDVILAYEQDGVLLDTERGGPLRLVKDGQHAKWVETIVLE